MHLSLSPVFAAVLLHPEHTPHRSSPNQASKRNTRISNRLPASLSLLRLVHLQIPIILHNPHLFLSKLARLLESECLFGVRAPIFKSIVLSTSPQGSRLQVSQTQQRKTRGALHAANMSIFRGYLSIFVPEAFLRRNRWVRESSW